MSDSERRSVASPFSLCLSFLRKTFNKRDRPSRSAEPEAHRAISALVVDQGLYALPDEILYLVFAYAYTPQEVINATWLHRTPSVVMRHAVSHRWLRLVLPHLFKVVTIVSWNPLHSKFLHRWFANQCGSFSDLNPMIHTVLLNDYFAFQRPKSAHISAMAIIEHTHFLHSLPNLKHIRRLMNVDLSPPPPPYLRLSLETLRIGRANVPQAKQWLSYVSTKTFECRVTAGREDESFEQNELLTVSAMQVNPVQRAHLSRLQGVDQSEFNGLLDYMPDLKCLELSGVDLAGTIRSHSFPHMVEDLILTSFSDDPSYDCHARGLLSLTGRPAGWLPCLTTLVISSTSARPFTVRVKKLLRVAPKLRSLFVSDSMDLTPLITSLGGLPPRKDHSLETFDLIFPRLHYIRFRRPLQLVQKNYLALKAAVPQYNLQLRSISGEVWDGKLIEKRLKKLELLDEC